MAAALFVVATVIAPIYAVVSACTMPCCAGESPSNVQAVADAACAEQCGIGNNTSSHQLPDSVAAPTGTGQGALAAIARADTSHDISPTPPPRLSVHAVESRHAVPGDALPYLYNSVFLI